MSTNEGGPGLRRTFWLDDRVVDERDAVVPVLDHGLLYGDGLFEGIRICEGRVFRLADHLRRLGVGARAIGLELPGGPPACEKAVLETARAHGSEDAYVRLIVTRGVGELGVDPGSCRDPRLIVIVSDIEMYADEKRRQGLALATSSLRRPQAGVLDPAVKSLNYLNSVLAKREARLHGADEALLLNAQGQVAEASGANVFAVRDGLVSTPPPTDGALPGITRRSVLEIAGELGYETRERSLGRVDLWDADEVFLTGSGARIVGVSTLDGERIGSGTPARPVTDALLAAFPEYARRHGTAF